MPLFQRMQDNIDAINGVMREQIMGIRVIRAFVKEDEETQRFADANREYRDVAVAAGRLMSLMFPTVMLLVNLDGMLCARWQMSPDIVLPETDLAGDLADAQPRGALSSHDQPRRVEDLPLHGGSAGGLSGHY